MENILFFVAGIALGMWINKRTQKNGGEAGLGQQAEKNARKKDIMALFDSKEEITNNDVERGLGVSDRSATRYLEELEQEGKIAQIGKTGRAVSYRRMK